MVEVMLMLGTYAVAGAEVVACASSIISVVRCY